jgi:hypothetical protein
MSIAPGSAPGSPAAAPGRAPARLPQRPIGSRLSTGHIATIVAGVLAAILSYTVLRGGSSVDLAVASRDLQARETITSGSFALRSLRLPGDAVKGFVTRADLSEYRDGTILVSVPKGSLIASSMLAPKAKSQTREVPVPVEAIPQGLAVGDLVDIGWPNSKDPEPLIFSARVRSIDPRPLSPSISVDLDYQDSNRYLSASGTGKLRIAVVHDVAAPAPAPASPTP